jgi:DNA-binding response OmpR family regulator
LPYSAAHCTSCPKTGLPPHGMRTGSIVLMTDSQVTPNASHADQATSGAAYRLSVLLYSNDIATRDAVRVAVGRRPARDVEVTSWLECATAAAVIEAVETGDFDLLVLDGETSPAGGLGLCRQLKNEIFNCPPVLVLTGRPQDGWLAAWSQADLAVPHPLDPIAVAGAVAELGRQVGASNTASA